MKEILLLITPADPHAMHGPSCIYVLLFNAKQYIFFIENWQIFLKQKNTRNKSNNKSKVKDELLIINKQWVIIMIS